MLLSHLKRAGKAWRLIVHKPQISSTHERPAIALLLDPLWRTTRLSPFTSSLSLGNGPYSTGAAVLNGLFLGALSHADDIRTLSTNLSDCWSQVKAVSSRDSTSSAASERNTRAS